jgi:ATP-dependent RNA helicase DHX57
MHPASVNFNIGRYECPWLIYTDLTETTKVFCREASMVPIYSLLLFGGELTVDHENSLVKLDGWATFKAPARVAVLVRYACCNA